MSVSIPAWAQPSVDGYRASKTLGQGASRVNLPAAQANQAAGQLGVQMDQYKQIDGSPQDADGKKDGVIKLALPDMGLPVKIEPPTISYEGDSNQGSSVMCMDQMGMKTVAVTDYSPGSIDAYTIIGGEGPMSGSMLVHIDRQNPNNSYIEQQGQVWNLMAGMMSKMGGMMGGMGGFG